MTTDVAEPVVIVCAALADDSRWRILQLVGENALSASELAEQMSISRQAIARHLSILARAGLVEQCQVGRRLRFTAIGGQLSLLARHLDRVAQGWDERLDRLRILAESPDADE